MLRMRGESYTGSMVNGDHADPDLAHMMRQDGDAVAEPKNAVTPLGAAGVGVAGAVAGAAIMVLWSPWAQAQPPVVSVTSCSEQYTTIADTLNAMVSEGIEAGQAPTTDVSWINSINDRQEAVAAQLESLRRECVDDAEGRSS